jgi:hypothetical protein
MKLTAFSHISIVDINEAFMYDGFKSIKEPIMQDYFETGERVRVQYGRREDSSYEGKVLWTKWADNLLWVTVRPDDPRMRATFHSPHDEDNGYKTYIGGAIAQRERILISVFKLEQPQTPDDEEQTSIDGYTSFNRESVLMDNDEFVEDYTLDDVDD